MHFDDDTFYAWLHRLDAKAWLQLYARYFGAMKERVYEISESGRQELSGGSTESVSTITVDNVGSTTSKSHGPYMGANLVDVIKGRNRSILHARQDALARANDAISELNRLGYFCKLVKKSKPQQ